MEQQASCPSETTLQLDDEVATIAVELPQSRRLPPRVAAVAVPAKEWREKPKSQPSFVEAVVSSKGNVAESHSREEATPLTDKSPLAGGGWLDPIKTLSGVEIVSRPRQFDVVEASLQAETGQLSPESAACLENLTHELIETVLEESVYVDASEKVEEELEMESPRPATLGDFLKHSTPPKKQGRGGKGGRGGGRGGG
ncbi:hypothetical protein LINGRAHAP2_LOCUS34988 [Linum grandiflorum]